MSDEMSAAIDAVNNPAPAPEFTPMPDAYAPEPEKKEKTFGGDEDGLKKAAAEVTERRAQESEVTERKYIDYSTGEDRPSQETVSLERASDDLTRIRAEEQQAAENVEKEALAWGV